MIGGVTSAQTSATGLPADGISERSGLVSVVINFFNEERFLAEAVDSVYAQTFHDWQLLLIDDGSSDRSSDIARAMLNMTPHASAIWSTGACQPWCRCVAQCRRPRSPRRVGRLSRWRRYLAARAAGTQCCARRGAPGCGYGLRKNGVLVELARHAVGVAGLYPAALLPSESRGAAARSSRPLPLTSGGISMHGKSAGAAPGIQRGRRVRGIVPRRSERISCFSQRSA